MKEADIRIYGNDKKPSDEDLSLYCTHCCHPDYVWETVFRFGLSSEYPQIYLKQLRLTYSSKLAEIKGRKVHLVLMNPPAMNEKAYCLFTFPDDEAGIAWFEKIFAFLADITAGKLQGKTEEQVLNEIQHRSKALK